MIADTELISSLPNIEHFDNLPNTDLQLEQIQQTQQTQQTQETQETQQTLKFSNFENFENYLNIINVQNNILLDKQMQKLQEQKNTQGGIEKNLNENLNEISNETSKNINELIELFSKKITEINYIDDTLIEQIYTSLKKISHSHNAKLSEWFDDKYIADFNEFINNNNLYSNLIETYKKKSFVIINDTC